MIALRSQFFETPGRAETGVMQFKHQPRGFFLRGKDANLVAQLLRNAEGPNKYLREVWADRLQSCWEGEPPTILNLEPRR